MPSATVFGFSKRQLKMLEVIILLNAMALSLVLPSVTSTGEIPPTSCPSQSSLTTPFGSNPCGMIKNTSSGFGTLIQSGIQNSLQVSLNPRNKDLIMVNAFTDNPSGTTNNNTVISVSDIFSTVYTRQIAVSTQFSSGHFSNIEVWSGFVSNNLVNSLQTFTDKITVTWNSTGMVVGLLIASFSNTLSIGNIVTFSTGASSSTVENVNMTLNYNNDLIISTGLWNPGNCSTLGVTPFAGSTLMTNLNCPVNMIFNGNLDFRGPLNPQGQTIQQGDTLPISSQWEMIGIELVPAIEDIHIQPFIAARGIGSVTKNSGIQNKYQVYFSTVCCIGPPTVPLDRLVCLSTLTIRGNDTTNDHAVNIALNDTTSNQIISITQITILAHAAPNPLIVVTLSGSINMATAFDGIAIEINFLSNTNFQITMIGGLTGPRINCFDINV